MALFWKKIISLENNPCFHPLPVKPLNLTSSLRRVGCAKDVFYTVLGQILCQKNSGEESEGQSQEI